MNEIEHEGKKYILKSQVEAIIKERVSKVAQKATDAESLLAEANSQLESYKGKQASVDVLTEQVQSLKAELASSKNRFERYQTMSGYGINDSELIEAIEWQYEKSMKGKPAKEKQSLSEWFETQMTNPEEAPIMLRPHIQQLQPAKPAEDEANYVEGDVAEDVEHGFQPETEVSEVYNAPPQTNRGAVPPPEGKDILRRAMTDQDFYNRNVDAIRQAWNAKYGR